MADTPLYPPIEPYTQGLLDVGDGQKVYWENSGNPNGKPAVVLHRGPGSGSGPFWRRLFDPHHYRVVCFDQRGCGQSTPSAGDLGTNLTTNTTHHLIADIERLRSYLQIDRWLVVGGSWGATLGLAYAERYPERVSQLVLFSVTTTSQREVDWITQQMGRLFPAEWERFLAVIPEAERDGNLATAYSRLLNSEDPAIREVAARNWCEWEDVHVSLAGYRPSPRFNSPAFRMTIARLVTHYWSNAAWLPEGELVRQSKRLAGISGCLIDGRLDVSGPPDIAWLVSKGWPDAERVIVDNAGHGFGVQGAVVRATDKFAQS